MKKILFAAALIVTGFSSVAHAGSCDVYVSYSSGNPASGASVQGSVSFGGMTDKVRTDRNGNASLTWSSDSSLEKVFVDGRTVGSCRNGGSLSVTK